MSETIIRDRFSKEIGYIKTDKKGMQTAYNMKRELMGCFDPKTNFTKDKNNRVLGNGNMLVGILLSVA